MAATARPLAGSSPTSGDGFSAFQRGIVDALSAAEKSVVFVRRFAIVACDRMQLRLRAWQTTLDPTLDRWISETSEALAEGSIQQATAIQRDHREIIDKWRESRP